VSKGLDRTALSPSAASPLQTPWWEGVSRRQHDLSALPRADKMGHGSAWVSGQSANQLMCDSQPLLRGRLLRNKT